MNSAFLLERRAIGPIGTLARILGGVLALVIPIALVSDGGTSPPGSSACRWLRRSPSPSCAPAMSAGCLEASPRGAELAGAPPAGS
jgi:hypothetical protein